MVNRVAEMDTYPIPNIRDLYAKLSVGNLFTKLDMSKAYEQLSLDVESRKYVTINTHRGLFTYKRMPYGVSSAPSIFQRVIDSLFQRIPNVLCYLDDILITGKTVEHIKTFEIVMKKLNDMGFHLKREKCSFLEENVMFLGHKFDSTGLHLAGATIRRALVPQIYYFI